MLPKRAQLSQLPTHWDLLVIGGGITGAGVALVASQLGIRVLLVEQKDYAWGTSSRSSKMVHGGLRYLSQGNLRLTRESLREREIYLKELPHLVKRVPYLFPISKGQFPGRRIMGIALWLYDKLAGVNERRWLNAAEFNELWPSYTNPNALGAYCYSDALTDDSRLVMRVLQEASANGAELINYVKAENIKLHNGTRQVTLVDAHTNDTHTVYAQQVINATGAWADSLSGAANKIRPLRGSHLVIPTNLLPANSCLTLLHPRDKRPVFIFPWQGSTLIGTTDHDHQDSLQIEAQASHNEIEYLLEVVKTVFPKNTVNTSDISSVQAGVRPVISSGKAKKPSQERREHLVWRGAGRINVSGGKLTTFRVIALDALKEAGFIDGPTHRRLYKQGHLFEHSITWPKGLGDPLAPAPSQNELLAWWQWCIRHEQVQHLDDLLLRRTHVGNHQQDGGHALLLEHAPWLQQELGWSKQRWQQELTRYQAIWQQFYQIQK